jgi:tetraacyldisaccharide 4'-kinase
MIFLYELLGMLLWPLVVLVVGLHPRLRGHFGERMGRVPFEVEPGAVWIHAASLGEGRAAEALVPLVRGPGRAVLRTCTSDTARQQRIGADQTVCLPVDLTPVVGPWLDRLRPRLLILVEGDLWPAMLAACRRRGIPVVVVGARVGPGTKRLRALPGVWGPVTRGITWLPNDAASAAVVGGAPIGELKREASTVPPVLAWTRDTLVAGCTHEGEEVAVLDAIAALTARPLLVLAPRDPRRFSEVGELLDARGERWAPRSALARDVPEGVDVVLLDTIGELAGLYTNAKVAFIGGTFDPRVGGHSPAEAQAAGIPVVHGPFNENHTAAFEAGESILALAPDDLADAFAEALALVRAPRVPVAPTASHAAQVALRPFLEGRIPPERALRPLLFPFAWVWRVLVATRPRRLARAPMPVISVGALTAGGSGKTPVAAWIATFLADADPVVVSRGYRRRSGNDVRLSGEAGELGDELAMLARRGLRVASAPDRLAGIHEAQKRGARVAILDDGLQNGAVARDLEIVVIDARWPTGGGTIPVGNARVPLEWLSKADVVWVNHGAFPAELRRYLRKDAIIVRARYRPVKWVYRGSDLALTSIPKRPAVAFAGIARPEGFFQLVRDLGVTVARTWVFPDHHAFVWADLQSIEAWLDDHVVLTTEKDAARLPSTAQVYALIVEPELVEGRAALEAKLREIAARASSA